MKYSLSSDTWDKEELQTIQDVIDGGRYTMGPKVAQFEKEFAEKFDVPYAVMVNSGQYSKFINVVMFSKQRPTSWDVIVQQYLGLQHIFLYYKTDLLLILLM